MPTPDIGADRLKPLFEGDFDTLSFVIDDDELGEWLANKGLHVQRLEAGFEPSPAVVLIVTDFQNFRRFSSLNGRAAFEDSRVLSVPMAAFDGSITATTYTVARILESDFEAAVTASSAWQRRLEQNLEPLRFSGPRSELSGKLADEIAVALRTRTTIAPGDWVAPGEYFEVELEALGTAIPRFHVEGRLGLDTILAAASPRLPRELQAKHVRARELVAAWTSRGEPMLVEVEDNQVVAFRVGAADLLDELRDLSNEAYDLAVLEFSIGLNPLMLTNADWTINSFMNEGACGVHIAVGDGMTGIHLDLVATQGSWSSN